MKISDFEIAPHLSEAKFGHILGAAGLLAGMGIAANTDYNYTHQPVAPISQPAQGPEDNSDYNYTHQPVAPISQPAQGPEDNSDLIHFGGLGVRSNMTPQQLKDNFVVKMKPMIDNQNSQIMSDRKFILQILSSGKISDASRYKQICHYYGSSNIHELATRVDIIPVNLTMAQAALESGWGRSSFAQNGNAVFGQKQSRDSNNFASFKSVQDSVAAYMHNLNTNDAYKKFRAARHYMRAHGDELNSALLARTLIAYDQTGNAYTKKVQTMINKTIPSAERLAMDD